MMLLLRAKVIFLSVNLNTNVWNKLYKRELFNDIRFPKGKIHEDEFVTYKVFYRAKTVSYVNKELYY